MCLSCPQSHRRLVEEHLSPPSPYDGLPAALEALTDRELEVFVLIARELTNAEVAARLVVSGTTVKTHVNRIPNKLGLPARLQAVVLAYETGLVVPGDLSAT